MSTAFRAVSAVVVMCLIVVAQAAPAFAIDVSITAPRDKASVPERPSIEGKVSDSNAKVWVVVHPVTVGDFWVQPVTTVKNDGTWKVSAYIGRPGTVDVGQRYEIRAFVNPKGKMREGDVHPDWPEAESKSDVVEVTRQ